MTGSLAQLSEFLRREVNPMMRPNTRTQNYTSRKESELSRI